MNEQADNNITVQVTHLESITINESMGKEKAPRLFERCSIHVHSRRKRLVDPDGVSSKAIIDGLVKAGILEDDSVKFIEKISYSQEKSDNEETIITIQSIDN